jgi:hypothetical protein
VGLCPMPVDPKAVRPAARAAIGGELERYDKAFLSWADKKDTRAGAANDNIRGNDTAAFSIAAEGYGRLDAGQISSDALIYQAVETFVTRCGW